MLTRRQKIILAALAIANIAVIVAAAAVLPSAMRSAANAPGPDPRETCSSIAAILLARRGIAGTASIGPDNILRLHLTGPGASERRLAQASDIAWDALVALVALPQAGCGPYPRIEVDVPAPDGETPAARLLVSVDWIDLRAWSYGELDDGALAARLQTTLYTEPAQMNASQ